MRRAIALLPFLLLLAWAAPVMAQTEIHHCIGANGNAVFTDQPCAALQATPVSPVAPPGSVVPASASPQILCAASLSQLRQSLIDAFARRDTNRMAGLMLWDGYGRSAAIADIQSLAQLMKQPLLDINGSADDPPAATGTVRNSPAFPVETMPEPQATEQELVVHTAGDDGSGDTRTRRFEVVHRAGCLWLRDVN